jgi:3-oxoadipate enol-lactonase/4-carboxymuconolactone decarboxylase
VPFVIRDGARLCWRSDGDPARPALLLGNSIGTDQALWAPVMPAPQRHFRHRPDLQAIGAPTLVTTGTYDMATPKELGVAIAAAIAGARCVELPVAHIAVHEAPGLYAHTVLGFPVAFPAATERERYDRGLARRKEVLGQRYGTERLKQVTPFNAEFQDLITRYAWGEMWTRNVLDDRTRRRLVLAMTIALGRWEEFELHVKAGLAADLSEAELKEVLLLAAIYCGVPAANTGFHRAAQVLRAAG